MDKEDILAHSREDNRLWDERDRRIADKASAWGAIGMGVVLAAVFLARLAVGHGNPYDLLAVGFGYLAAANAYKWGATKARTALLVAVLYAAVALGWLWLYAVRG